MTADFCYAMDVLSRSAPECPTVHFHSEALLLHTLFILLCLLLRIMLFFAFLDSRGSLVVYYCAQSGLPDDVPLHRYIDFLVVMISVGFASAHPNS